MGLLEMPTELLLLLPRYIHDLNDYTNLASTCHKLHRIYSDSSPRTVLGLAAASSHTFFRPDPHFLIAATVRQVSDWALLSHENTEVLRQAMRHGIYALLDLCVAKAGLTLNDIRRLHASRFSLINLVSDMFDKCAGLQSNAVPKDERMSDLERSLFHIIIYGELFASTMAAFLHPQLALPRFDHEFRMDYIKYCIPDPMCRSYKSMTVLKVGPYAEDGIHLMPQAYDQDDLAELFLRCPACRQVWERVRLTIGPDFTDEWRQQMWCSALRTQGWKGLEMQLPERVEIWRPKLQAIQNSIATLPTESKPEKYIYQREHCWESPNMAAEISVTLQGSELY